jgi:hypothetical protein
MLLGLLMAMFGSLAAYLLAKLDLILSKLISNLKGLFSRSKMTVFLLILRFLLLLITGVSCDPLINPKDYNLIFDGTQVKAIGKNTDRMHILNTGMLYSIIVNLLVEDDQGGRLAKFKVFLSILGGLRFALLLYFYLPRVARFFFGNQD